MRWAARDYYRWRRKFALVPRKIGGEWVWLEHFEWRFQTANECKRSVPALHGFDCYRRTIDGTPAYHFAFFCA